MEERIRLTDQCEPALKEGIYEIEATEEAEVGEKLHFTERKEIVVSSRRFRLWPDEIYSVYPPADSSGEYEGCIPHIIFNRDTIPWEREMFREAEKTSCPWLMLLLLAEGEDCRRRVMTIAEALEGRGNPLIYMGKDTDVPAEGMEKSTDQCVVVELCAELAVSILPEWEEVKLLAHGRLVSLEDKVTDAAVKSGWFSCLAANRYVESGEKKIRRYQVCLVSLKGFEELLEAEGAKKKRRCLFGAGLVRFFVLYEWEFTSTASPYSFSEMIRGLRVGALKGQIKGGVKAQELRELLERGYFPLNHRLRDGSQTVSWYRGPLIPQYEKREPFHYHVFSDQLSKYDPDIGMLDMSYACAWQLGRMLAFQNQSYCRSLIQWRFQNYQRAANKEQEKALKQLLQENGEKKADLEDLLAEQCRRAMSSQPVSHRGSDFYSLADGMSGGIDKETFFKGIKEEIKPRFPDEVKEFLMEGSLLYHVPFWYLLPDQELLGEEELRFFWLDGDWLLHFLDGMCSIARNASIDYRHDEELLGSLFQEVMEENDAVRRKRQGKEELDGKEGGKACTHTGEKQKYTGFLLRSALVKDFRGLEFQAYNDREGGEKLQALRLDTLGGNVLFGIFRGEIRRLVIGQPPEGLHFGMELTDTEKGRKAVKYLRSLNNGILNDREAEVALKEEGRFQCMDVKRTKDCIAAALGSSIQSAGFALEMIQNAHSGVFRIQESG